MANVTARGGGGFVLGNGTSQYQIIVTGVTPFAPGYSGFFLDGAVGGKTVLAVTSGKTLTLTAVENYNVTIPESLIVAGRNVANTFTETPLTIQPSATWRVGTGTIEKGSGNNDIVGTGTHFLTELSVGDSVYMDYYGTIHYRAIASISDDLHLSFSVFVPGLALPPGQGFHYRKLSFRLMKSTGELFFSADALGNLGLPYPNPADPGIYFGSTKIVTTGNITTGALELITVSADVTLRNFNGAMNLFAVLGVRIGFTNNVQQLIVTGHTTQNVAVPIVAFNRNDAAAGVSAMLGLTALGSGSAGDGGSIGLFGKSSTTAAQSMAAIDWSWNVATHASRTADLVFSAYDTAKREGLRIRGAGAAAAIGFYGTTPVALQTGVAVTAEGIHAALVALGLITA